MATETRAIKQLDIKKRLHLFAIASVVLVLLLPFQVEAKIKAKPQNIDAKGKEGAKHSSKQKSLKKFTLKKPLKMKAETNVANVASKKPKTTAKLAPNLVPKTTLQTAPKTFFISKKAPPKVESSTHEMFKAFSSNQQNQLIVQAAKSTRASGHEVGLDSGHGSADKSKKMPSLLPTSSSDSQRAASMLEADSGVHGDDGYTRTQIVDAPVRKPAAVAAPKTPERVAVTFEHETK